MSKGKSVRKLHHLCADIGGLLKEKKGKLTFLVDEKGNPIPDQLARVKLNNLQIQGHQVIPTTSCPRFDKIKGCLGHVKSIMPSDEEMAKIELECKQ